MKWFDSARARLRLLFARRAAESRMNDEFRFHVEMETDRLMRAKGLAPDEARRQALAAFGGVEKHKEALRDGRGLAWLSGMSLDVKLGGRMLLKYPGLTLAGGLALAIAIGIGAGWYDLTGKILAPTIPLPEGDRLVSIETQNTLTNEPEPRVVRDFLEWRRELRTIEDLGAYRTDTRNLIVGNAAPEPIRMAELTAAAFRTARVPPLLGRALLDSDEMPGAPSVVVLGYDVWQRSLGGRQDVVGSVVKLGNTPATVIGVMPEGFRVPGQPRRLDATAAPRLVRCARGRCDQRHRQAGSWRHAGAGERRAARARRTSGRGVSGDARASPAARDATPGEASDFSDIAQFAMTEPAGAAGADDCVHERRHAGLREDGDTGGGNRRAFRARCEPRAHHRSTLRGGPRARVGRGRGRSHRRRPGGDVGDRKRQPSQRRRTVLDDPRPEALDDSVCRRPRGRQRGHVVTPACAESHAERACNRTSRTWAPVAPRCASGASGQAR